jgi:hypothetical protein
MSTGTVVAIGVGVVAVLGLLYFVTRPKVVASSHFRNPMVGRQKWDVYWIDPETGKWEIYGRNLSRAQAERLARKVTYFLAPRWGFGNIPTKIVGAGL